MTHAARWWNERAALMHSRPERLAWPDHTDYLSSGGWPADTVESTTTIRYRDLWGSPYGIAEFVIGVRVPDIVATVQADTDRTHLAWLYSLTCRSWAVTFLDEDRPSEVYQGGARKIWDELEAAHRWWDAHNRPGHDDLRLTVTPHGQQVGLE